MKPSNSKDFRQFASFCIVQFRHVPMPSVKPLKARMFRRTSGTRNAPG